MQTHTSTVTSFLTAPDVTLSREPRRKGISADWIADMIGCSVLIEEKASRRLARPHMVDRAVSQLESIETELPGQFRILWLACGDSTWAPDVITPTAQPMADDEFFQQHQGIHGVVHAHVDEMKVQAHLAVNPYSRHADQLASSPFAKCLANPRYFPIEFPNDVVPGIVSGAQPKLLLQRDAGGTYSAPRRSFQQLKERMDVASDIAQQLYKYFERKKSENPDWTDEHNLEHIRRGLQAKAIDGKWPFTQAEQRWIMARLRELRLSAE